MREHERQGVQATTAMQKAACAVALENKALRFLLGSRGLAAAEIDAYLQTAVPGLNAIPRLSMRRTASTKGSLEFAVLAARDASLQDALEDETTPSFLLQHADSSLLPSQSFLDAFPLAYRGDGAGQKPQILDAQGKRDESETQHLNPQPQYQNTRTRAGPQQSDRPRNATTGSFGGDLGSNDGLVPCPNTLPANPECNCAHEPAPSPKHATSRGIAMEKSCEEAASILAQLRGGSELDDIRRDLGCSDEGACVIRNTELLQIMDELPGYTRD